MQQRCWRTTQLAIIKPVDLDLSDGKVWFIDRVQKRLPLPEMYGGEPGTEAPFARGQA
jgi:hypothetical protein